MDENYLKTLRKKAAGYSVRERTSEYVAEDGRLTEVKRKIQTKHVPADLAAIKFLLELGREDFSSYTDEQLESERRRLLAILAEEEREQTGAIEKNDGRNK